MQEIVDTVDFSGAVNLLSIVAYEEHERSGEARIGKLANKLSKLGDKLLKQEDENDSIP